MLVCIHELGKPFLRGFQCDDESIRYPYKDSTISSGVCYSIGSGLNIFLILLVEYLNLADSNKDVQNASALEIASRGNDKLQVKVYLWNVYCRLLVWFFGAISSELITDITKFTAGRLRPHFIELCKPMVMDGAQELPLADYCRQAHNPYEYITNFYCTGGTPHMQRDARLSFLSGHSSYSAYSATFAVFYIQSTIDISRAGLIKPVVQVLIVCTAFYVGLSRISDYKHHWQDVLAGLVLGTTLASLVSTFLWPPLYSAYSKFLKSSNQQLDANLSGEELNRFSY